MKTYFRKSTGTPYRMTSRGGGRNELVSQDEHEHTISIDDAVLDAEFSLDDPSSPSSVEPLSPGLGVTPIGIGKDVVKARMGLVPGVESQGAEGGIVRVKATGLVSGVCSICGKVVRSNARCEHLLGESDSLRVEKVVRTAWGSWEVVFGDGSWVTVLGGDHGEDPCISPYGRGKGGVVSEQARIRAIAAVRDCISGGSAWLVDEEGKGRLTLVGAPADSVKGDIGGDGDKCLDTCSRCGGSGVDPDRGSGVDEPVVRKCRACGGNGKVWPGHEWAPYGCVPGDVSEGDEEKVRAFYEEAVASADLGAALRGEPAWGGRCEVTGNPCGTDTWEVNHPCTCGPCSRYVARTGGVGLLGPDGEPVPKCPRCGRAAYREGDAFKCPACGCEFVESVASQGALSVRMVAFLNEPWRRKEDGSWEPGLVKDKDMNAENVKAGRLLDTYRVEGVNEEDDEWIVGFGDGSMARVFLLGDDEEGDREVIVKGYPEGTELVDGQGRWARKAVRAYRKGLPLVQAVSVGRSAEKPREWSVVFPGGHPGGPVVRVSEQGGKLFASQDDIERFLDGLGLDDYDDEEHSDEAVASWRDRAIEAVRQWCNKHDGVKLPVDNEWEDWPDPRTGSVKAQDLDRAIKDREALQQRLKGWYGFELPTEHNRQYRTEETVVCDANGVALLVGRDYRIEWVMHAYCLYLSPRYMEGHGGKKVRVTRNGSVLHEVSLPYVTPNPFGVKVVPIDFSNEEAIRDPLGAVKLMEKNKPQVAAIDQMEGGYATETGGRGRFPMPVGKQDWEVRFHDGTVMHVTEFQGAGGSLVRCVDTAPRYETVAEEVVKAEIEQISRNVSFTKRGLGFEVRIAFGDDARVYEWAWTHPTLPPVDGEHEDWQCLTESDPHDISGWRERSLLLLKRWLRGEYVVEDADREPGGPDTDVIVWTDRGPIRCHVHPDKDADGRGYVLVDVPETHKDIRVRVEKAVEIHRNKPSEKVEEIRASLSDMTVEMTRQLRERGEQIKKAEAGDGFYPVERAEPDPHEDPDRFERYRVATEDGMVFVRTQWASVGGDRRVLAYDFVDDLEKKGGWISKDLRNRVIGSLQNAIKAMAIAKDHVEAWDQELEKIQVEVEVPPAVAAKIRRGELTHVSVSPELAIQAEAEAKLNTAAWNAQVEAHRKANAPIEVPVGRRRTFPTMKDPYNENGDAFPHDSSVLSECKCQHKDKQEHRCPHDGGTCHHNCDEDECYREAGGMSLSTPHDGYPLIPEGWEVFDLDGANVGIPESYNVYVDGLWVGIGRKKDYVFTKQEGRWKIAINHDVLSRRPAEGRVAVIRICHVQDNDERQVWMKKVVFHTEHCKARLKWGDGECECHRLDDHGNPEPVKIEEEFKPKYIRIPESSVPTTMSTMCVFGREKPTLETLQDRIDRLELSINELINKMEDAEEEEYECEEVDEEEYAEDDEDEEEDEGDDLHIVLASVHERLAALEARTSHQDMHEVFKNLEMVATLDGRVTRVLKGIEAHEQWLQRLEKRFATAALPDHTEAAKALLDQILIDIKELKDTVSSQKDLNSAQSKKLGELSNTLGETRDATLRHDRMIVDLGWQVSKVLELLIHPEDQLRDLVEKPHNRNLIKKANDLFAWTNDLSRKFGQMEALQMELARRIGWKVTPIPSMFTLEGEPIVEELDVGTCVGFSGNSTMNGVVVGKRQGPDGPERLVEWQDMNGPAKGWHALGDLYDLEGAEDEALAKKANEVLADKDDPAIPFDEAVAHLTVKQGLKPGTYQEIDWKPERDPVNQLVPTGVAVILLKDIAKGHFVLLGKRKGAHGEGEWSLPGGRIQPGEDPLSCAVRELEEETGIVLHQSRLLIWEHCPFNSTITGGQPWVTLFYWAMWQESDGEPKLMEPNKCSEWDFFLTTNLPEPMFEAAGDMARKTGWKTYSEPTT